MRWQALAVVFGIMLAVNAGRAAEGLVLRLPFDGDYNSTVGEGVAQPFNSPQFVEGKFGRAVKLEGSACLAHAVPDCVRQGEFTLSFWIKPLWDKDDGVAHPLLVIPNDPRKRDKIGWGPNEYLLSKGFSDVIAPDYLYGVANSVCAKQLKRGEWTHVMVGFSAKEKLRADYFNGRGGRSAWTPESLDCHGDQLWLGSRGDKFGGGDFVLDDLRVYNHLLTEKELPAVAGAPFPPADGEDVATQTCDTARAVETPHVTWAKPYFGGKVKALGVTEVVKTRELLELAQRADIEVTPVGLPALDGRTLANKELVGERGRAIEEALKTGQYQLVILAAYPWDLLADSTRAAVMAFVENGGGLMLVTPWCVLQGAKRNLGAGFWAGWKGTPEGDKMEALLAPPRGTDARWLLDGIPWRDLDMFVTQLDHQPPSSLFRVGEVGKGRVLLYDLRQLPSFSTHECLTPAIANVKGDPDSGMSPLLFDSFEYDYALGAAAKAALWAANKVGEVRVERLRYEPQDLESRLSVGQRGRWLVDVLNAGGGAVKAELRLTLRGKGPDAPVVMVQGVLLKPGMNTLVLGYAIDRVGAIFCDAQALVDGKVADWASYVVDAVPGNPYLGEVKADRELYRAGQEPLVTVSFALVKYAFRRGETGDLGWRLYDGSGRLVERGRKTVLFHPQDRALGSVPIALSPLPEGGMGYTLVVELGKDGKVTDQRLVFLRRHRDPKGDFLFTLWDGCSGPTMALATQVLRDRYHADCFTLSWPDLSRPFGAKGMAALLDWYNQQNLFTWVYATHIGNGSQMADAAQERWLFDHMAAAGRLGAPRNVLFYSLGDEVGMGDPMRRPSGFEQEDFRVQLQAKHKTIAALNQEWGTKFNSWEEVTIPIPPPADVDSPRAPAAAIRRYREDLLARYVGAGLAGARSTDPDARVGVEGMAALEQAYPAGDLWSLAQASTFLGPYSPGMEQDMIRSFQKPGSLLGGWYNYLYMNRDYSLSGPWTFLLSGADTFQWFTIMGSPDVDGMCYSALNPDFSPFVQFAWTYEELGPILGGIGKLCKTAARDRPGVAILFDQRNIDRITPALWATKRSYEALKHIGVWPDFIHGEQIKAGELAKRNVKVLWLPHQVAMDEDVAQAIRSFVEAGGAVVADTQPAVNNGFHDYAKPLLADLFAKPAGVAAPGKGKTLFLGLGPGEWLPYRHDFWKPGRDGFRRTVAGFLKDNGVAPRVVARPTEGDWEPLGLVTYHLGASLYVAFQRGVGARVQHPGPRGFEFADAGGKSYVYDVRAGKLLGDAGAGKLTLECARGGMLAFLPYRAEAVVLEGLPAKCRQGESLVLRLSLKAVGPTPEGGVFRVECLGPDGKPVEPLRGKFAWGLGGVSIPLRIAYNDPPGTWTLVVTDIATGVALKRNFNVE